MKVVKKIAIIFAYLKTNAYICTEFLIINNKTKIMNGINEVLLLGTVGSDPETKILNENARVSSFRLATNENFTSKDGTKKENTEWHNVEAWNLLADTIGNYVKKGSHIIVRGKIKTESFDDKDVPGKKVYRTKIVMDTLHFLPGGNKNQESGQGVQQASQQPIQQAQQPVYQQQPIYQQPVQPIYQQPVQQQPVYQQPPVQQQPIYQQPVQQQPIYQQPPVQNAQQQVNSYTNPQQVTSQQFAASMNMPEADLPF